MTPRIFTRINDASPGTGWPNPETHELAAWPRPDATTSTEPSWSRLVFPGVFLLYLAQTVSGVHEYSRGIAAVAGYTIVVVFCVGYLACLALYPHGFVDWVGQQARHRYWLIYGFMVGLWVAEYVFARNDASVMATFLAVLTVASLGARAAPTVIGFTLVSLFLPPLVTSWHQGVDTSSAVSIPMIALAMFGFFAFLRHHAALQAAQTEMARLAAENERNRIARDLHDLLGHSLTTITVKAGLARRLRASDPEGAAREIAEVEQLSRQALADVRAAVTNYRETTLAGELATAHELLRAAGIVADLPRATDVVDVANQELFGWVLREGLTNVVRHSHATECVVVLTADSLEIRDNGTGRCSEEGNGLRGLRERVNQAGGLLEAGPIGTEGWFLRVVVGP